MKREEKEVLLSIRNLKQHFKIDKKKIVKAIDDVSFDIYKGEVFGLVGESGSGKSTTGRSIIGLYNQTGGEIFFKGKNTTSKYSKEEKKQFKKSMQMIFQDPYASLNPRMTVEDIIGEGLEVYGMVKDAEDKKKQVMELLKTVGLDPDHASRYPHEFSGGQRQRIGIARALAVEPDFIIADEPISALDVSIQAQVVNLMRKLQKDRGLTYMFIAHDLSMVKYISDRIAVMYRGKIVELADADELYRNPLHPYTKSLLSAIPLPNPEYERHRKRIAYDATMHNYETEKPEWTEITSNHFVYASKSEIDNFKKEIK